MHIHWDAEHTINGEQDALELHLVHYAKQYDNTTYAAEFEDGIAVVGVLFEVFNWMVDICNWEVIDDKNSEVKTKL